MTQSPSAPPGFVRRSISRVIRLCLAVFFCLSPITALVTLGWLNRRTCADIDVRLARGELPEARPNMLFPEHGRKGGWRNLWGSPVYVNFASGIKLWLALACWTAPVGAAWCVGWMAGWEASFTKGYEVAGAWPFISLVAVMIAVPVFWLMPMIVAHQVAERRVGSAFELRRILNLVRAAGWRYAFLTILIALGCLGVFAARGLPVFAEHLSDRVASGLAEASAEFAAELRFAMTALLVIGLLLSRTIMARTYAHAVSANANGRQSGRFNFGLQGLLCASVWLAPIFVIYLAQFLNYHWWSWFNHPMLMLPWLGIFA
ncbi:MAG: hypothetical protein K0U93_06295 [Gammaproteobacteria bacterium]|nr:hypothetical protein [Gammaproteobacteria bacterium]